MENIKAKFHLPGIASDLKLNLVLITMLENCPEYFREGVEIASCYGAFVPSTWAGGRILLGGGINSPEQVQTAIASLNERGIPLRFIFTNPLINTEHLSDNYCNMVMQIANNGMNEVVVASEVLEDYIRKMYPDYRITSCKYSGTEKLNEELEKDYNLVTVDYDLNNKWDIIESLPHKEKCEFIVNSACLPECPKRTREYETIGQHHIDFNRYLNSDRSQPFKATDALDEFFNCPVKNSTPFETRKLPHNISPDAIWNEYIPKGFNNFRIDGIGAGKLRTIENYMYYLTKPEYREEAYFMFMHNLERNGVVKIDNI
ncbi:MAG: hypothetical protein K2K16_12880 [Ruminococcus sp.]|nr:hypothetical protein [Ruminococcus sp.]